MSNAKAAASATARFLRELGEYIAGFSAIHARVTGWKFRFGDVFREDRRGVVGGRPGQRGQLVELPAPFPALASLIANRWPALNNRGAVVDALMQLEAVDNRFTVWAAKRPTEPEQPASQPHRVADIVAGGTPVGDLLRGYRIELRLAPQVEPVQPSLLDQLPTLAQ
jgi:hypothetical protein